MAVPGLWCCAQAFSACSARASRGGGFSCCGAKSLWQVDSEPLDHQGSPKTIFITITGDLKKDKYILQYF